MKTCKKLQWLVLMLIVVVGVVVVSCKDSNSPTTPVTTVEPIVSADTLAEVNEMETKVQQFEEAIQLMEAHMRVDTNGLFVLEMPQNAKVGINSALFESLKKGLEETNQQILSGVIRSKDVGFGLGDDVTTDTSPFTKGCKGRNGWERKWWGFYLYLDDCKTHTLIYCLKQKLAIDSLIFGVVGAGGGSVFGGPLGAVVGALISGTYTAVGSMRINSLERIDELGGHDGFKIATPWGPIQSQ